MLKHLGFGVTLDIYRVTYTNLRWYHRDAKRIMQRKHWNSRKYHFRDNAEVFIIRNKKMIETAWLVEHKLNIITGEERIIPKRQVTIVEYYNNPDLVRIKRRTKKL